MNEQAPVIVFDVNETLSDMSPLDRAFEREGLPGEAAGTWFAGVLRDGFAATASGDSVAFERIARGTLTGLAHARHLPDPDAFADRLMADMAALEVHPDVVPGVTALARTHRLITLGNGAARTADTLLRRAGVREHFAELLSVQDAPAWKPAAPAYHHAVSRWGGDPRGLLLVAVHPWDVHGAHLAGLRTAWLNRGAGTYPEYFTRPDVEVGSLTELARRVGGA